MLVQDRIKRLGQPYPLSSERFQALTVYSRCSVGSEHYPPIDRLRRSQQAFQMMAAGALDPASQPLTVLSPAPVQAMTVLIDAPRASSFFKASPIAWA